MTTLAAWSGDGWQGHADAAPAEIRAWLAAAAAGSGRASRHARTVRVGAAFVKSYPAPGGRRALHAWRIGEQLAAAGFAAPQVRLVARRGDEGLLVTADVGGESLLTAAAHWSALGTIAKRTRLRALGAAVARLHAAGFVHGDLVPPNVQVVADGFVFIDHDRTRRSRVLVALRARRNLVQLGRFVIPGITTTDRWRVLTAYAERRSLSVAGRRRLARWVAAKILQRRVRLDRLAPAAVERAGFRAVMQAGGAFDAGGPGGAGRQPGGGGDE